MLPPALESEKTAQPTARNAPTAAVSNITGFGTIRLTKTVIKTIPISSTFFSFVLGCLVLYFYIKTLIF